MYPILTHGRKPCRSDAVLLGPEAFRWTAQDGMIGLGKVPGGAFYSVAVSVSDDEQTILTASVNESGEDYYLWTQAGGFQSVRQMLLDAGVTEVASWRFNAHHGSLSADGLTITGFGTNPLGQTEGWVATIPEPVALLSIPVALLPLRRWRSLP